MISSVSMKKIFSRTNFIVNKFRSSLDLERANLLIWLWTSYKGIVYQLCNLFHAKLKMYVTLNSDLSYINVHRSFKS